MNADSVNKKRVFNDYLPRNFRSRGIDEIEKKFYRDNYNAYLDVLVALHEGNLVPFWGAGFVANLFPLWEDLLDDFAKLWKINLSDLPVDSFNEASHSSFVSIDLEKKASYLLQVGGKYTFYDYIKETLSKPKERLSTERLRIREIFQTYHITTNFDNTIENIPTTFGAKKMSIIRPHSLDKTAGFIQRNEPCVFKIHGDIEEEREIILTKDSYDRYYPEENKPTAVKKALAQILSSSYILFVGCSLDKDRTLQIIKNCADTGCRFFALVPLPEETKNDYDPYAPNIIEGIHKYNEKLNFLQSHSITPIWYPWNHHNFVDSFLNRLYEDKSLRLSYFLLQGFTRLPADIFVGRFNDLRRLNRCIDDGFIALVTGEAGVGKTELCYQQMLQMRKEKRYQGYLMIDCKSLKSIDELYKATIDSIQPKHESLGKVMNVKERRKLLIKLLSKQDALGVFWDNFQVLNNELLDKLELCSLLADLHHARCMVIITASENFFSLSSQEYYQHIPILPMQRQDVIQLFRVYLRNNNLPSDGPEFDAILEQVAGNALIAMLIIGQSSHLTRWNTVLSSLNSLEDSSSSLHKICQFIWKELCENDNKAKELWGIFALCDGVIPLEWIFINRTEKEKGKWDRALAILSKYNLLSTLNGMATMSLSIREEFNKIVCNTESAEIWANCVDWWLRLIESLITFEMDSQITKNLYIALNTITNIIAKDHSIETSQILTLTKQLHDYYSFDVLSSENYLKSVIKYAKNHQLKELQAYGNRYLGFILYHCDEYQSAIVKYETALDLFDESQLKTVKSGLLHNIGDAYRLMNQYKNAWDSYTESENYLNSSTVHIADKGYILRGKGIILCSLQNYKRAEECFTESYNLFFKANNKHGYANMLLFHAYLKFLIGDYDQALQKFENALKHYSSIHKCTGMAYAYQGLADILSVRQEYDQAIEKYKVACHYHNESRNSLGVGDVLMRCGEIMRMKSKNEKAMVIYKKSQEAYDLVNTNLTRANILYSIAELKRQQSDNKNAIELYKKAKELYQKIGSCRGLANTHYSMGCIKMLGKNTINEAVSHYEHAAAFYKKVGALSDQKYVLKQLRDHFLRLQDARHADHIIADLKKSSNETSKSPPLIFEGKVSTLTLLNQYVDAANLCIEI